MTDRIIWSQGTVSDLIGENFREEEITKVEIIVGKGETSQEALEYIKELLENEDSPKITKKIELAKRTVSVKIYEFKKLLKEGKVKELAEWPIYVISEKDYKNEIYGTGN